MVIGFSSAEYVQWFKKLGDVFLGHPLISVLKLTDPI